MNRVRRLQCQLFYIYQGFRLLTLARTLSGPLSILLEIGCRRPKALVKLQLPNWSHGLLDNRTTMCVAGRISGIETVLTTIGTTTVPRW